MRSAGKNVVGRSKAVLSDEDQGDRLYRSDDHKVMMDHMHKAKRTFKKNSIYGAPLWKGSTDKQITGYLRTNAAYRRGEHDENGKRIDNTVNGVKNENKQLFKAAQSGNYLVAQTAVDRHGADVKARNIV